MEGSLLLVHALEYSSISSLGVDIELCLLLLIDGQCPVETKLIVLPLADVLEGRSLHVELDAVEHTEGRPVANRCMEPCDTLVIELIEDLAIEGLLFLGLDVDVRVELVFVESVASGLDQLQILMVLALNLAEVGLAAGRDYLLDGLHLLRDLEIQDFLLPAGHPLLVAEGHFGADSIVDFYFSVVIGLMELLNVVDDLLHGLLEGHAGEDLLLEGRFDHDALHSLVHIH